MERNKTTKPCNHFAGFFYYCPARFLKPHRTHLIFVFLFGFMFSQAQNKLQKQLSAEHIDTISINGNKIFDISVSTSKTDEIVIISTLDGEYQNDFQIVIKEENNTLNISLEHLSLTEIPDDKRNAHKVIAAALQLEIPEGLSLNIISDIGSVDLSGDFNTLSVELLRGHCEVSGKANNTTINTIDGDINVVTQNASIDARSSHGNVVLDEFSESKSLWKLQSINGNITVANQE